MSSQTRTISEMFDYSPGNHGLTEEIIYSQKPLKASEAIPVFSGSSNNERASTFIRSDAANNKGVKLSYFDGPCLILTKDGSAGLLTYKGPNDRFTINHHACVLHVKTSWKKRLDPKWFALQFQNSLFRVTTSKSDNRVFSTEWFDRLPFEIPDITSQRRQLAMKERLTAVATAAAAAAAELELAQTSAVKLNKMDIVYDGPIAPLFSVHGGNSGLTEEFIYNNQPLSEADTVTLRSGATLRENEMGAVAAAAVLPNGKNLKVFDQPCILLTRKGYAGALTFLTDLRFSHNDDAYVLIPRDEWKEKINLLWFVANFSGIFRGAVTSAADNATFNKEWLGKMTVQLPTKLHQDAMADYLRRWQRAVVELEKVEKRATELLSANLKTA